MTTSAVSGTPAPVALEHPRQVVEGRLVARYDRFIAEVELSSGVVRAHCVNPGGMEGQVIPGARVWLVPNDDPKRKLKFTWVMMEEEGELVGVDTTAPNRVLAAALAVRAVPGLRRYTALRSEVSSELTVGGEPSRARVDFVLEGKTRHYVEAKNVHLIYPDRRAYFPDTVSERATHHVEHLAALVERGERATVLFVVQRQSAPRSVRPSMLHDPAFAEACRSARDAGVNFRGLLVRPSREGYSIGPPLRVDLRPYATERHARWRQANRGTTGWKRSKR